MKILKAFSHSAFYTLFCMAIVSNAAAQTSIFRGAAAAAPAGLQIINVLGQVMQTMSISQDQNQVSLDVSQFVNGVYFLRLYDEKGMTTQIEKFTVRH